MDKAGSLLNSLLRRRRLRRVYMTEWRWREKRRKEEEESCKDIKSLAFAERGHLEE